MIERIISGGQSGADQAGLRAARAVGIPTGGSVPKGWLTEDGPATWLAEWGLKEHWSDKYPPRTKQNVIDSDATIWFGRGDSRGYGCTRRAALDEARLWFEVGLSDEPVYPRQVADWIRENDIRVLNVAGNRASVSPGIGERVERFLTCVFRILKEGECPRYWPLI